MNDAQTLIDHASIQSDRWLFLAMLVILLGAGLVFWRWIVADREKVAVRLTDITDRHIDSVEKLDDVVANNTAALREVKDAVSFCRNRQNGV